MRMRPPVRAKKLAQKKGAPRFTHALGTPATIALVFCVMGAAILIAISRPAPPDESPAATGETRHAATASSHAPVAVAAPRAMDVASANASDREPDTAGPSAPKVAPVTMTGCLEQNDETVRLREGMGFYSSSREINPG